MPKTRHISDDELIQFADVKMPVDELNATAAHLHACDMCRSRFDQLKSGFDAYGEYHSRVLKPSLEPPPEWPSLQAGLEKLERPRGGFSWAASIGWAAAAFACCVFAIGWHYHETPSRRMQQVLTRAVEIATRPHRRLQITAGGRSWYRAATLHNEEASQRGLDEMRAMFVKANYSWHDPLSARSFADWRKQLPSKRDQVFSIDDRDGKRRFYRLQTETPTGVLRSAALTLRADTLNPVKGAFEFEHQNEVTIEDAGEMPQPPRGPRTENAQLGGRPSTVKEVDPAEELRVFAALNSIGADVGEPVTVDVDPSKRQIVVAGLGLSATREQQIRQAIAPLPSTVVRFTSGRPVDVTNQSAATPGTDTSNESAPLRSQLEAQAGGAQAFQLIADKALDTGSAILGQANALYVLSQKFPSAITSAFSRPDRDILNSLRRSHAVAIEQSTLQLKDALKPLFNPLSTGIAETQVEPATSWEVGAAQLYEQARRLDDSLGRILGGHYSQDAGQSIWSKLPDEIERTEALARFEEHVQ